MAASGAANMVDDTIILDALDNPPPMTTPTSYSTQQEQLLLSQLLQQDQFVILQENNHPRGIVSLPGDGASEFAKKRLKNVFSCDDHDVCPICLDSLVPVPVPATGTGNGDKGVVVKTPCDHMFHQDCIFRWLDAHATCPSCRRHL